MENLMVAQGITKIFPGVKALDSVNLSVKKGEIHCIMGENGAGKSTLIKTLTGVYPLDGGTIHFKGKKLTSLTPQCAIDKGISVVHQDLNTLEFLTIEENITLGREISTKGFINKQKNIDFVLPFLKEVHLECSPQIYMNELSVANKQLVIIAKALSQNASLIIFDEPTTMLSEKEVTNLFNIIKKLKEKGIGIIYITHRMNEIYSIGDRISILKDGSNVSTHLINEITMDEICNKMVGRELSLVFPPKSTPSSEEILKLEKIYTENISDITFSLKKGEVLGIAGLVGSGRTEILNAIFGVDKILKGDIHLNGKLLKRKHIRESLEYGIAYIPEDRKSKGIIGKHSILENFSLLNSMLDHRFGFYNTSKGKKMCDEYIKQLSIKTPNIDEIIGNLSGGNQQKVVLAKWLSISPNIILLDEPTQGIDVGSKAEIYNIIHSLTSKGISIILVSSELIEIINLCNQVIVMKNNKICTKLEGKEITEEKIISYAMGVES